MGIELTLQTGLPGIELTLQTGLPGIELTLQKGLPGIELTLLRQLCKGIYSPFRLPYAEMWWRLSCPTVPLGLLAIWSYMVRIDLF